MQHPDATVPDACRTTNEEPRSKRPFVEPSLEHRGTLTVMAEEHYPQFFSPGFDGK